MINSISVRGFKSLLKVDMPISGLNVLVGGNAAGKSTVIQALLMLRQSVDLDGKLRTLKLNGALFSGGKATDIFHPVANRQLRFLVEASAAAPVEVSCSYQAEEPNSRQLQIVEEIAPAGALFARDDGGFAYLNAERLGPRVRHPLPVEENGVAGALGIQGEYIAHVLTSEIFKREQTLSGAWAKKLQTLLGSHDTQPESLKAQARAALEYVIPGAGVDGRRFEELDNAGLFYAQGEIDNIRPTHIGFGLSYALPVIAAPLVVGKEGLIIVENPEAHLHPLGQSRMGRYLALAANDGAQIVIETHSDHVVNGIRRAVKMGWLPSEKVLFHFFERRGQDDSTRHVAIRVDADGHLSAWPEGFFDQFENDLSKL